MRWMNVFCFAAFCTSRDRLSSSRIAANAEPLAMIATSDSAAMYRRTARIISPWAAQPRAGGLGREPSQGEVTDARRVRTEAAKFLRRRREGACRLGREVAQILAHMPEDRCGGRSLRQRLVQVRERNARAPVHS